jgi:hypothetical protein
VRKVCFRAEKSKKKELENRRKWCRIENKFEKRGAFKR